MGRQHPMPSTQRRNSPLGAQRLRLKYLFSSPMDHLLTVEANSQYGGAPDDENQQLTGGRV